MSKAYTGPLSLECLGLQPWCWCPPHPALKIVSVLCVCTCACVHAWAYVHPFTCLLVMPTGPEWGHWVSSSFALCLFLRQSLSLTLTFAYFLLNWLATGFLRSACVCPQCCFSDMHDSPWHVLLEILALAFLLEEQVSFCAAPSPQCSRSWSAEEPAPPAIPWSRGLRAEND